MSEFKPGLHLEIAHVLFIDVVGYSKLLADEQSERLQLLNEIVRGTAELRTADQKDELIRLPTGDGMALVFLTKPEAPVQCALEISKAIKSYPELQLRMGIHSGSVNQIRDVNDRLNVTGAGINTAQRVMDCGDAGHILLSRRVAEDLEQYRRWQPHLHDLGECEVKHGVRIHVFNFYTDEVGNRDVPTKLKPIAQETPAEAVTFAGESARSKHGRIASTVLLMIAVALGFIFFWVVSHRAAPKSTSTFPKRSPSSSGPVEIGKPLDLPALAQKAGGAVVLIGGRDAAGNTISGSGFFVSADGRLVTNHHVMQGMVNAQARLESGAIYNIDGILASSSALDLAALKADARDMQFLLVDDASNPPQPGTRIAVIGSPHALEGSLSEGIVSAIRSGPDGSLLLQISAPISPGSSGSPVLDRYGRVVGVATMTAVGGQNLNFARSSQDLRNFLLTINQNTKPKALSEKKDEVLSDPDFIAAKDANGRGDGAAALKLLNTLQQHYRNEPRLLFQLGCAYENLGLYDEAYRNWRAYIDIDPADPYAWRHFAIAAANLNRTSEAINAYKQALKIKSDSGTWRGLGDLYRTQGQSDLSAQAYAKALEEGGKITATPQPSPTSPAQNGKTWQSRIGDFVRQFVAANQSADPNPTLLCYAPIVSYFEEQDKDQAYIRQDIEKYNERWPIRRDEIEGDIHLQEKVPDREYAASFKLNFYAESPPRQIWTKGQFAIDLNITIVDGQPKISGIREKMVRQEKGKPGESAKQSPVRKGYPSGIAVPGKSGFVHSPYAPSKGEIDVRRYRKGTAVKCPFTGKIFVVP
jgi:S1-C subfamily serine protease/class 3 adenylate cyclase/Tfp pilus assembly protein PilF